MYISVTKMDSLWFFFFVTGRVDNVYGDRNLICTLQPPQEEEEKAAATA